MTNCESALDVAMKLSRSAPISKDCMAGIGFGRDGFPPGKKNNSAVRPFVKISMPNKAAGKKGKEILIGIKGEF